MRASIVLATPAALFARSERMSATLCWPDPAQAAARACWQSQWSASAYDRSERLALEPVPGLVQKQKVIAPELGVWTEVELLPEDCILGHERAVAKLVLERGLDPAPYHSPH